MIEPHPFTTWAEGTLPGRAGSVLRLRFPTIAADVDFLGMVGHSQTRSGRRLPASTAVTLVNGPRSWGPYPLDKMFPGGSVLGMAVWPAPFLVPAGTALELELTGFGASRAVVRLTVTGRQVARAPAPAPLESGIYFRVQRAGKWGSVDLVNLEPAELETLTENWGRAELLRTIHKLASLLREGA